MFKVLLKHDEKQVHIIHCDKYRDSIMSAYFNAIVFLFSFIVGAKETRKDSLIILTLIITIFNTAKLNIFMDR